MKTATTDLDAIVAVSEAVNKSLELDCILEVALDTVLRLKGLDAGTIRLLDEDTDSLILKAYRGFPPKAIEKLSRISLGEKFSGLAAKTGEPLVVHDIANTPWLFDISQTRPELKSLVSIPLRSLGKIAGTMNIYSPHTESFDEHVIQLLKAIGLQIGIAIENGKLLKMYQRNLKWSEQILSSSPVGMITLDMQEKILSCNDASVRMLDISLELVRHRKPQDAFKNHPQLVAAFKSREPDQEIIYQKTEGGTLYLNMTTSPITDEEGQEQGSIIVFQDVTKRKKTDEQIQRISRLIPLGELATGIAHEIRNPLAGISYVLEDLHDHIKRDEERRCLFQKFILFVGLLKVILVC